MLYVTNREEWREWLEKNYAAEKEIWLVYYKKDTGKPAIPYDDSVEEAICFGWVDSLIKRIDNEKYARKFTPRTTNSSWSESNKKRAHKMISAGRMTETGLLKIEEAKKSGTWSPDSTERNDYQLSKDFQKILESGGKIWENYNKLAPSHKRNYIGWIMSAKKEETRKRRFDEFLRCMEQNKKPGMK